MKNWRIKVLTGPSSGKYLPVQPGLTLGRSRAGINLNDPKASSIHAVIKKTSSGKVVLVDNDSRNGTKVNGEKKKKIILHPGVIFQIGSSKCQVIDFQKYLKARVDDSKVERYGQPEDSQIETDYHGDELKFGSTDSGDLDATELDRSSAQSSPADDVSVLGNDNDSSQEGGQYYQDAKVSGQRISATPRLNIKKFEEKDVGSVVDEESNKFNFGASSTGSSPFNESVEETSSKADSDFGDLLATNPSFSKDAASSTPSMKDELDNTMVLEVAKESVSSVSVEEALLKEIRKSANDGNSNDDPFKDLEGHIEKSSSPAPAGPGEESKNILATVAAEDAGTKTIPIEAQPQQEDLKPKVDPINQDSWVDIVGKAIETADEVAENNLKTLHPLEPGVRLIFTQGPQLNTEWTIGYGPRNVGPSSTDFPIIEQNVPDVCFSIHPADNGVLFKTAYPDRVSLNGRSTKTELINSGDTIRIGESTIEVETF